MEKSKIFFGSTTKPADEKYNAFMEQNPGISVKDSRFIPYNDGVFEHVIFLRYDDGKKKTDNSPINTGLVDPSIIAPITLHSNEEYEGNPLLLIDDIKGLPDKNETRIDLLKQFKKACPFSNSTSYKDSMCYSNNGDQCAMEKCMYFKRVKEYYKRNIVKKNETE